MGLTVGPRRALLATTAIVAPPAPDADTPPGAKLTIWGDSMTAQMNHIAYIQYLLGETGGFYYFPPTINGGLVSVTGGNCGISGQDSTQIAARKTSIVTAGSDVYIGFCGENNAVGDAWTVIRDDIRQILELTKPGAAKECQHHYILPIPLTDTCMNNPILVARAASFMIWGINDLHTEYANATFLPNAWAGIELCVETAPGSGAWITGADTYDGTHLKPNGAKKQAANIAAQTAHHRMAGDALTWLSTGNLNTAYDMAGIAGTDANWAAGDTATGYVGSNTTGATVTPSVVTHDGRRWQRLEITGVAAAESRVRINRTVAHVYALADTMLATARVRISNIAGNGPPTGLKGYGLNGWNVTKWMVESYGGGATGDCELALPLDYLLSWSAGITTAGGASNTMQFDIRPDIGPTLDIAIEIADWRAFNLTQLGLA